MTKENVALIALGSLGGLFLLSLSLALFLPGRLSRVTLTFPNEISKEPSSEVRSLPLQWDSERNAELIAREILLGPVHHENVRLFPKSASVDRILARNGTLYVDLSVSSLFPDRDVIYSPRKALEVFKSTLLYNLREFSRVEVTVAGQPVLDKIR